MMGETLQRKLEDVPITVSSPEPGTVSFESLYEVVMTFFLLLGDRLKSCI